MGKVIPKRARDKNSNFLFRTSICGSHNLFSQDYAWVTKFRYGLAFEFSEELIFSRLRFPLFYHHTL